MKYSRRPPTRKEIRARAMIVRDSRTAERTPYKGFPGSFSVFRGAELLDDDDKAQKINEIMDRWDISPTVGRQATVVSSVDAQLAIAEIERKGATFDYARAQEIVGDHMSYGISKAVVTGPLIVGASANRPGQRFLALALDHRTGDQLNEDRGLLLGKLKVTGVERELRIPHVSLGSTHDQLNAQEALRELKGSSLGGLHIMLGVAVISRTAISARNRYS